MIFYIGYVLLGLGGIYICKNILFSNNLTDTLINTKTKYTELYEFIKKNEHNNSAINKVRIHYKANRIILSFIFNYLYDNIYNSFLLIYNINNVKRIDNKTFEITYYINKIKYVLVTRIKRGPNSINRISDENDEDITNLVLPYLGPNIDCHHNSNKRITPNFFGKKQLYFSLDNDISPIFFNQEENISLPL